MRSRYGFELDADREARKKRDEDARAAAERARTQAWDARVKPIWQRVLPILKLILEDFAKARGWEWITVDDWSWGPYELRVEGTKKFTTSSGYHYTIAICIDEAADNSLAMLKPGAEVWRRCHRDSDLDALGRVIANETRLLVTAKERVNPGEDPARWKAVKSYKPTIR